ncbi:MAG TPA: hypothetical protein VNR60_08195 [Croceibacterium sp.]|nr:hypothetical protein [Croceibacterium sp.]
MPVSGAYLACQQRTRGVVVLAAAAALTSTISAVCAHAQDRAEAAEASIAAVQPIATYADLADLSQRASIVALIEVRDQSVVRAERAPGLAAGQARLYVTAQTVALLAAGSPVGESLNYLVDMPLDAKGKPPKLKKQRFIIFADPVSGRPGSLQLVSEGAQLPATPESEQSARSVIAQFAAQGLPPGITGVRDVMSVAGNLVGESETQLFLETSNGEPASLTVVRRPGMEPSWGISWNEIVDQSARPPEHHTVEWYRLACSLPRQLPAGAYLQDDREARVRAESDYRYILEQLGPCARLRT